MIMALHAARKILTFSIGLVIVPGFEARIASFNFQNPGLAEEN
jgi:hypothetical protein